jgi:hypothetical protein
VITDEQIRRVQAANAERDAAREREKKLVNPTRSPSAPLGESVAAFVSKTLNGVGATAKEAKRPIGKTLVEVFSEEEAEKPITTPVKKEEAERPIGKTLVEVFSEEDEDGPTDPGTSLMEILSREDTEHG